MYIESRGVNKVNTINIRLLPLSFINILSDKRRYFPRDYLPVIEWFVQGGTRSVSPFRRAKSGQYS